MELIGFIEELLNIELEEYQKVAIMNVKKTGDSERKLKNSLPIPPPIRIKIEWGI